eukprot:CAMPEP_0183710628 /NCGR_PEP_ID=MMETSP0737-20130205/6316_1 /TAXON_ID=385413 /ORGANISM="Thalassiosira miniscula, Strain CCMP1093" /LENGTH=740 /DNA_ID=CAMNT_0025938943 /DNA_START=66 /DNA_END=2288 /DNA_ORIENTATION=+
MASNHDATVGRRHGLSQSATPNSFPPVSIMYNDISTESNSLQFTPACKPTAQSPSSEVSPLVPRKVFFPPRGEALKDVSNPSSQSIVISPSQLKTSISCESPTGVEDTQLLEGKEDNYYLSISRSSNLEQPDITDQCITLEAENSLPSLGAEAGDSEAKNNAIDQDFIYGETRKANDTNGCGTNVEKISFLEGKEDNSYLSISSSNPVRPDLTDQCITLEAENSLPSLWTEAVTANDSGAKNKAIHQDGAEAVTTGDSEAKNKAIDQDSIDEETRKANDANGFGTNALICSHKEPLKIPSTSKLIDIEMCPSHRSRFQFYEGSTSLTGNETKAGNLRDCSDKDSSDACTTSEPLGMMIAKWAAKNDRMVDTPISFVAENAFKEKECAETKQERAERIASKVEGLLDAARAEIKNIPKQGEAGSVMVNPEEKSRDDAKLIEHVDSVEKNHEKPENIPVQKDDEPLPLAQFSDCKPSFGGPLKSVLPKKVKVLTIEDATSNRQDEIARQGKESPLQIFISKEEQTEGIEIVNMNSFGKEDLTSLNIVPLGVDDYFVPSQIWNEEATSTDEKIFCAQPLEALKCTVDPADVEEMKRWAIDCATEYVKHGQQSIADGLNRFDERTGTHAKYVELMTAMLSLSIDYHNDEDVDYDVSSDCDQEIGVLELDVPALSSKLLKEDSYDWQDKLIDAVVSLALSGASASDAAVKDSRDFLCDSMDDLNSTIDDFDGTFHEMNIKDGFNL